MDRNVSVITDLNGNKIVVINDIVFKGKRSVNWDDVEVYLKQYVGRKKRHNKDVKYGWYRYTTRFALPIFDDDGEIERYNVFHTSLLIRHAKDKKMYLYDVMAIKKEMSTPFQSEDFTK